MAYINLKKVLQVVKTQTAPAVYQEKTITPQNQTHEITADAGYQALSKVILDGLLVDPHESYTTSTDSTTAYQKSVPAGALKYGTLDKVGCMSYKCNNKYDKDNITLEIGTIVGETGEDYYVNNRIRITQNSKFFLKAGTYTVSFDNLNEYVWYGYTSKETTTATYNLNPNWQSKGSTFTLTNDCYVRFAFRYSDNRIINNVDEITKIMLNEGSTALPYQPYFEGIRDSAVTSVVSKDSNNTTLDTLTIPAEVQALEGYGCGINDTCYNYIDFETKKFIKNVIRIVYNGSEDWQDRPDFNDCDRFVLNLSAGQIKVNGQGLCDSFIYTTTLNGNIGYLINNGGGQIVINYSTKGTTTLAQFKSALSTNPIILIIEIATPVETDISQYIDNNFIEVAAGGALTFNNTYEQSVPSEVTYLVEVQ